jgi:dTDP-4-amino-4,6-dideoxygalactose transaminase
MGKDRIINVTKSYLPELSEYVTYLEKIWENSWVTNHGPMVGELERRLGDSLGVKHVFFICNGTIALQIAIKALGLRGDIITTPFSYVATTSSIVWEGCRPVFVDIDPDTLAINPSLIEQAITPDTTGILATHIFGIPCDVDAIGRIAEERGVKVIYDAAHAFGVGLRGRPLPSYGDVSTLSFHATKLFHTVEGGAVVTNDDALAHKISYMRNFGHRGQESFWGLGINGKGSELHAAIGLCVLPRVEELIRKRKNVSELYDRELQGTTLKRPRFPEDVTYNYAYYPVLFVSEERLLRTRDALNSRGIFPRRYFYPSLNLLPYTGDQRLPVSEDVSKRILCLPLSHELNFDDVGKICQIVTNLC